MSGEWRKQVGSTITYRGYRISVRALRPDVLAYVNDEPLPNPYVSADAARNGGRAYVDNILKEKEGS